MKLTAHLHLDVECSYAYFPICLHVSTATVLLYLPVPSLMGRDSSVGIATGWMVRGVNPGGSEIFHTRPDRP